MKRIARITVLLSVVLLGSGCGRRPADGPVAPPPDIPRLESDTPEPEETPVATEPAAPAVAEETVPLPPTELADSPEAEGEVSQRKVLSAVGKSFLQSIGIGGAKDEAPEEAPIFEQEP